MAQVITTLSAPSVVEGYVRGFIYTDTDGSERVNQSALLTFLSEQFGYLTTSGASPTAKDAEAGGIAQRLASMVNRERFAGDPAYPVAGNSGLSASDRLGAIRLELINEVRAMEAPYYVFQAGIIARGKTLFNDIVAPGFPPGEELPEVTRVYVETFVTDRGEESRPSPATAMVTMDSNDECHVTCGSAPSGRNITHRRLYRSSTGTTSSAFRLQGEYPIATTAVLDIKTDAQLNDVCPTFGWLEPVATLAGLAALPNGIMTGYSGRTLYACEPYHPYAWPAKYDKPLARNITGTVAVGQSLFVGTTGRPYLVSGSDSASLSEELISSKVPCSSARSMVAIGNSVFYASPDGLALYENGRVVIVTKDQISRKAWRAYVPDTMRAGEFDGMYMAFYTKADATKGCLVFDYESKTLAELDQAADAVFSNEAGVYVLNGTAVLDLVPDAGANRTGYWYSKTFRLARPQAFAWIMVDGDFAAAVTVRVYAGGVLHHTASVTSGTPVRNKPGRASEWQVQIETASIVSGVVLASTTDELKAAV